MTCPNCKRALSCGCQRATATNGVVVCTNCVAQYNASLLPAGNSPGSSSGNTPIVNESLKITPPPIKTAITPEITGVKYNNFQG